MTTAFYKKAAVAGILFSAALNAPVVPDKMELVYSYQTPVAIYNLSHPNSPTTSAATMHVRDMDGSGIVSVSVFRSYDGSVTEEQITNSRYDDMGKRGGYSNNPTKYELRTPISAITPIAEAAIAVQNTAQSTVSSATSLTFAHTTSTGSNRILLVGVDTVPTSDRITSVTYNGSSASRASSQSNGVSRREYMYYLTNPSTGSNNVVITASSATYINGASVDYTGAAQTGQPDSSNATSGANSTSYSITFTTVCNNSWSAVMVGTDAGGSNPTASTNSTSRVVVSADSGVELFDSNAAITPAGAYAMSFTSPVSTVWVGAGMSIAPDTCTASAPSVVSDVILFE